MEASSGGHNIPKIMTFRPTWEEFKDFNKYITYIESQGAHKAGICKIIPPKEWVPRSDGYGSVKVTVPAPIQQVVHGRQGIYTQYNVQKKPIDVVDFERLANSDTYKPPRHTDYDDLERKYWKNITFINPIYGADVSGSLTDKDQYSWNIQKLGSILDCLGDDYGISIEGVNTAYLYFGMWKTTFAWHTEDMDLYSINYVHYGAPKRWYAIPPEHGRRLERLAAGFFPDSNEQCQAFLRHKMSLISPTILKRYSIPVDTIVQEAGEIMITFPYGYHSGFNHGFNCAESTNFASERWIEYGKRCVQCHCRKDSVKIDMGAFVRRFQPKLYQLWKNGQDIGPHPEDDQSRLYNHHHNELVSAVSPSKRHSNNARKRHCGTPVITMNSRDTSSTGPQGNIPQSLSGDASNLSVKKGTADPTLKRCKKESIGGKQSNGGGARIASRLQSRHEKRNGSQKNSGNEWLDCPTDVSDALTDVSTDALTDAQTDISDVLTDEESEPHADGATSKNTEKSVNHAQTHTGQCKVKKQNKNKESETDLLKVEYAWSKSLSKLWRFNPPDFEAEKRYNLKMSQRPPFCSVCSVISQHNQDGQVIKPARTRTPRTSTPFLPQSCFTSSADFDSEGITSKLPSKPRALLICKSCNVCVHDTCYGVKFLPDGPQNWKCSRCSSAEMLTVECALCSLRGGALKPTENGRWAHIVCAIANTEIIFKSVSQREPIDISQISRPRATLKCTYCGLHTFSNGKDRFGKCVQCTLGQCNKAFHLTCAQAAGVKIEIANWPYRLYITCMKHLDKNLVKTEDIKERPVISVADEVYAKHKNGRYYKGEVVEISTQMYYCVLFEDNSTSKDLFPEDIINYKPRDGNPPLGSFVNVKWPDGLTYNGHFQGTREVQLFTVEFEDTSQVQMERDQIFSVHEQLPAFVQKRLSFASEMKNDQFYRKDNELLVDSRTRGVQVNYNYKWDFIAQ